MSSSHTIDSMEIVADSLSKFSNGYILQGSNVVITVPSQPGKYLYSGWQSWSLTSWIDINRKMDVLRPRIMHPREIDPQYSKTPYLHGSWYGAVEISPGKILFLGSLGLNAQVFYTSYNLVGKYEGESDKWFLSIGDEKTIFRTYTKLLGDRYGRKRNFPIQRVWCSWYSLYSDINEILLLNILEDLGNKNRSGAFPFDVFQVDDGWQIGVGNWEPNNKFPTGMDSIATKIKKSGRTAGLWLAPFIVTPSTPVFNDHPDWLLRDEKGGLVSAGYNWGEYNYPLDLTHPAVLDWLSELMRKVQHWGYDYVKLDFLYAGALPGKRFKNIPREDAFRIGLKTIRDTIPNAYILTCGTPIIPSIGLCDGMRIGQDVAEYWSSNLFDNLLGNFGTPGVRNAIRNVVHRLWLQALTQVDPDVVYFNSQYNKLTKNQKILLQKTAEICQFKATSDLPQWLTTTERENLFTFLNSQPEVKQLDVYEYEIDGRVIDFKSHIKFPPRANIITQFLGAVLGELANFPVIIDLADKMDQKSRKKRIESIIPAKRLEL